MENNETPAPVENLPVYQVLPDGTTVPVKPLAESKPAVYTGPRLVNHPGVPTHEPFEK
jgi:hypothetical protein